MEDEIKKQQSFMQARTNEAKMGAYYTDLHHCEDIHKLLDFPKEEVCCLEPSIGDGSAILKITDKINNQSLKIFGVEINKNIYKEVVKSPMINGCIYGDFLSGVRVSHQGFSFCFANPPYGTMENGKRMEVRFLQKLLPYLNKNGVVVYVIPYYVASSNEFLSIWCRSFKTIFVYKFREREYKKFQQVVLIGERGKESKESLLFRLEEEQIRVLPTDYQGEKVKIYPSYEKNVTQFMADVFQPEVVLPHLEKSPLQELVQKKMAVPAYGVDEINRPPVMPNNGQLYLMAISGAGQGLVGSEESKDLHLQRGVIKTIIDKEFKRDENEKLTLVETKHAAISYTIIEADGQITELK